MQATPLRHHVADSVPADGVWPLGTTEVTYVEQAEVTVLDILRAATDLSADSPELDAAGEGAAVTYHLNSRRANVVRFLDLPADAAVLEVGAGCGAVTRYLGETCAVVDALEPMPRRAAVARERCRDLTTVEVFAGELGDVPAVPAYDVVLVNGVLEYVGNGSADPAPYVAFLGECAARLLPGGVLIVAIENQLGVKYVVGSPEDHTDHEFDSLEGYPRPNHARVFSRRGLTGLLAAAGLEVAEVLGAFPDYKRTAVLMAPSIDTVDSSLPYRIPPFPSPDRRGFRHRVADEAAVWRTIVEAGLTWEFPNSFVVLAHTPGEPRTVWPRGRHAVFARNIRRPEFSQRTVVEDVAGVPTFRRILNPAAGTPVDGVRLVGNDAPYQPGVELMDVLRTADDEALATWLARWAELVRQWPWDDGAPLDLLPHNALLSSDDEIVLVDDEYRADGWTREDVLARGVLTLALKLAGATSATRWTQSTVGELAAHLGTLAGLADGWLDAAVEREAGLRATVRGVARDDARVALRGVIAQPLADGPLDLQAVRRIGRLEQQIAGLEQQLAATSGEAAQLAALRQRPAFQAYTKGRAAARFGVRAVKGVARRVRSAVARPSAG